MAEDDGANFDIPWYIVIILLPIALPYYVRDEIRYRRRP
jgi:hypothetical protein